MHGRTGSRHADRRRSSRGELDVEPLIQVALVVIVLVIFIVLVQRQIKRPLPFFSFPRSAVETPAEMPAPPPVPSTENAAPPTARTVSDEEIRAQMPPGAVMVE